ncbi:MAG: hypothetical protein ABDH91_08445 [Bacteroidia bacterium]
MVAFFLQLWVWEAGGLQPAATLAVEPVLAHALRDADSLLAAWGLRDTLLLSYKPLGEGYEILPLPEGQGVQLLAEGAAGWAAALYTLLERKHGFLFLHPQFLVRVPPPPLPDTLRVMPRFRWRGFHLHTQHPIELTEALHDPNFPQAELWVRQYIDWLARNRQNYFEFCLLRTVNLVRWAPYFQKLVAYAHQRGISVGLDVSLRMRQQYAFQLLPRYSLRSRRSLLRQRLRVLAQTGIDRLNVELTAAEFVGQNWGRWLDSLVAYCQAMRVTLMTRQHVVPPEAYAVGTFRPSDLPPAVGLCVHSVMCYSLRDTLAPVYRCRNFAHLLASLREARLQRQTWYYPETAYWVTFDNSVPVWLLSYLRARWEDIELTDTLAEGHLTFSSGWDIGYWLFDWSVAQWSWAYWANGQRLSTHPAEGLARIFGGSLTDWAERIRFQDSVLVGRDFLSYITPTTPIDELGWYRLPAFQPRLPVPPWRIYRRPEKYRALLAPKLNEIAEALQRWPAWPTPSYSDSTLSTLWEELRLAWEVTRLRVAFRYHWLEALSLPRSEPTRSLHLARLHKLLNEAEGLVAQLPMRYPHTGRRRICRAGPGCRHPHPSYAFGYLYPALSLHFWRREIGQVEKGKWSPFYKNLWNIPRIIGLW